MDDKANKNVEGKIANSRFKYYIDDQLTYVLEEYDTHPTYE